MEVLRPHILVIVAAKKEATNAA
ncbi:hypothetical protein L195_g056295, partial [Trifolium pratense]